VILYLCVITYQYDGREPFEVAGRPTSKLLAIAALSRDIKLTFGSEHVLSGRVYSEADYRKHQMRQVAEFALVAE
jgi:hypothetical protein